MIHCRHHHRHGHHRSHPRRGRPLRAAGALPRAPAAAAPPLPRLQQNQYQQQIHREEGPMLRFYRSRRRPRPQHHWHHGSSPRIGETAEPQAAHHLPRRHWHRRRTHQRLHRRRFGGSPDDGRRRCCCLTGPTCDRMPSLRLFRGIAGYKGPSQCQPKQGVQFSGRSNISRDAGPSQARSSRPARNFLD